MEDRGSGRTFVPLQTDRMKTALLAFLLLPLGLLAQSLRWGPPMPLPEDALPAGAVWCGNGFFVAVHPFGRQAGAVFEKYDAVEGKLLDRFELTLGKLAGLEEVFAWRGKIYLLIARYRYNALAEQQYARVEQPDYSIPPDSMSLWMQAFDPMAFRPEGEPGCLVPMHARPTLSHRAVLAFSPDSGRMACALLPDYPHERFPGTEWLLDTPGDRFWYAVADDRGGVLRADSVRLPVRRIGEKVLVRDWAVDNRGEVAVAAHISAREGDFRPNEPYLHPTLFFLGAGDRKTRFCEIPGEGYLHNLRVRFDAEDRLLCAGFFSPTDYGRARGVFFLKIDASREKTLQRRSIPFPDSIMAEMIGRGRAKKNGQLEWTDLYHFEETADGGLLLAAEAQQIVNGAFRYGDLLVFGLKPNGEWAWGKGFRRSLTETGAAAQYLSFALWGGATGRLLMNLSTRTDGGASCTALSAKGALGTVCQWKHADADQFLLCPALSRRLPDGTTLVLALKRNRKQFRWGFLPPE
jgi:hypothetical protein